MLSLTFELTHPARVFANMYTAVLWWFFCPQQIVRSGMHVLYRFVVGFVCAPQTVSQGIHLHRLVYTCFFVRATHTVSPGMHLHRRFTLFSTRRTQCGLRLECFQCALARSIRATFFDGGGEGVRK